MRRQINAQLLSLLIAVVCLSQFGCSSQSTQPQATASPTPAVAQDPAGTLTPAPTLVAATGQPPNASAPPASALPVSAPPAAGTAPGAAEKSAAPPPAAPLPAPTPPPPPPPPRTFTLAAGRSVSIFTSSTLSTKSNKTGEAFSASLVAPIVDGDWVIAKKGALVEGVIEDADPGGRTKGVASMSLRLTQLTLADGRTISLNTDSFTAQAKSTKKKDAAKIGIGAGVGAAIGAIAGGGKGAAIGAGVGGGAGTGMVLATRGDPAVVPSEAQLTFKLTSSVTVTKR